jgi:hypothetical protein
MPLELDLTELGPLAQKLTSGQAPEKAVAMAARGLVMGAKPAEVVTILAWLSQQDLGEIASTASQTLKQLPPAMLDGALGADLQGPVIDVLVETLGADASSVERLLRMPRITESALCRMAERADEKVGELVATNERLLLTFPKAIEKLYMNKRVRMSTADRVLELAVRNQLQLDIPAYEQAAKAIMNELIPEPTAEPSFDDQLFAETQQMGESLAVDPDDDAYEASDDGEETVARKFEPLHKKLADMTISQKIRTAILGSAAERMLLIRDTNRLVASAAVSSPQFTENEAARVTASKNVHDDVLRIIAKNRTLTRGYQVKLNLVTNPKTPLTFASHLLQHIRDSDLRTIAKSKNVPANIQAMARQQLQKKQQQKRG